MYPAELEIKDTTENTTSASYLDLLLSIGRDGQLHTSIYGKRDDFNFHITNFPFLGSNIPSSPAYGVFIFQLLLLVWMFHSEGQRLSSKLLKQGYLVDRLKSSFRKFYGRFGVLIQKYEASLSRMLNDILTPDQQWLLNQSYFPPISWPWYRTWPSPNFDWFPWSICNGCGMPAGNAYPSVHLVPSPCGGLACAPIVETRFLELAMSILDFSPWIPLGTFSILLQNYWHRVADITRSENKLESSLEKKEEIWLSPVTKTPTPTGQSKKQRDNIKTPPKTLITQLLRTDLGRSVGATAVTQLVWLYMSFYLIWWHIVSRIYFWRNLLPGILRWSSLQTKESKRLSEFRLVGLKNRRLRRRKHDQVIIGRTIGFVIGASTVLHRYLLKHWTLTNKAVGTILRDLSKPPQKRQNPDQRLLLLLVGIP